MKEIYPEINEKNIGEVFVKFCKDNNYPIPKVITIHTNQFGDMTAINLHTDNKIYGTKFGIFPINYLPKIGGFIPY